MLSVKKALEEVLREEGNTLECARRTSESNTMTTLNVDDCAANNLADNNVTRRTEKSTGYNSKYVIRQ